MGIRRARWASAARPSRSPALAEGTLRAGPAIAAVLLNTAPFFVAVIGRLALHERVTALRALGLVIGFTGVLTIILAGNSSSGEDIVIGAALTLLGAIGYGSAGLLMRYLSLTGEPLDIMGLTAAQFLCGAIFLLPYLFLSGDVGATDWSSRELWWSIAFIVIGAQVIAYLGFYAALSRWPSSRVYPWTFLVARRRDPHRGDPRQPPGPPANGRHGDRRGRPDRRQPAGRGGSGPAVDPGACAGRPLLDGDVAEHARLGEPIHVRICIAALRHQHLACVLAAPRCRAQLREAAVDAQR